MKIKATFEVEYEVDPDQYSFSEPGDKKEAILKFERNSVLAANIQGVTVVGIEEVEEVIEEFINPFKAYISRVKNGTQEHFREIYLGKWDSEKDFARYVLKIKYPEIVNVVNSSEVRDFWFKHCFAHTYFSVKSKTGIFVFTKEKQND